MSDELFALLLAVARGDLAHSWTDATYGEAFRFGAVRFGASDTPYLEGGVA